MLDYHDTLQMLFSVNLFGGVKLGLNNIERLLECLGQPHTHFPTIHVAGTNGKGSVCWKMARTLEKEGFRVGLYTSPHISCFRERISINKKLIPEEEVTALLNSIFALSRQHKIPATFFEMTTALAFAYFAKEKIDIAVLETGLGGRLDATNVVQPLLTIITSISLEHTDTLGTTIEAITKEKGGIIKPHVPLLIGPCVNRSFIEPLTHALKSPLFQVQETLSHYDQENTAIAQAALNLLPLPFKVGPDAIAAGTSLRPPCRLEVFPQTHASLPPFTILDVAHNPDGIKHLCSALDEMYPQQKFRIVLGLSKTKDISGCLKELKDRFIHLHLVEAENGRGISVQNLHDLTRIEFKNERVTPHDNLTLGIQSALHLGAIHQDPVLIIGTFFIMNRARKELGLEDICDQFDLNERSSSTCEIKKEIALI